MRAKKGECSTEISFALQHTHTGTQMYTLIHSEWAVYLGFTAENNAQILFERGVQLKTGGQSNGRVASGQLGIELTHTHSYIQQAVPSAATKPEVHKSHNTQRQRRSRRVDTTESQPWLELPLKP